MDRFVDLTTPVRLTGRPQRLFNNARSEGQISDVLDCRFYNAVAFQVYVSGSGATATLTVKAAPEQGGPFLTLFDPYAVRANLDDDISFDVISGLPWIRLELSDVAGSFGNNEGFTIIGVPYTAATNPSQSRPQWYDRRPEVQIRSYVQNATPHARTIRWSYTVPANRKAWFDSLMVQVNRTLVATSGPNVEASILYTPVGGSATPMLYLIFAENAVASSGREIATQLGAFVAGDTIEARTADSSTGGANDFVLTAKYTEFDA